jgi:hypothetical protein
MTRATCKEAVLLSVPLGLAAFLVLTARAVVPMIDGPKESLYGFPLFWIKPGPTSLSVTVDTAAALVDVACYQALAFLGGLAIVRRWPRRATSYAARAVAWGLGVAVVVGCVLILSGDASGGGVTFDRAFRWGNVESYTVHVGVPGRR